MEMNILEEYASLEEMSVKELLKAWPRYFNTLPKTKSNKKYLVNELIYCVQALAYGGRTKKTIDRLEALAESKTLSERKHDNTRLAIGTHLIREVKGVEYHVTVLEDGYEYQGTKYKSLSGAAFAITGTRWNGNAFFGLLKNKATRSYHKSKGCK
jgi:hypothetical protein